MSHTGQPPGAPYRGSVGSDLAGTRNSRVAPKSAPGTEAGVRDSASRWDRPQQVPLATRRSALQQENETTRERNVTADAFAVAVSSSSSSQVRPSERGPVREPAEWVDDSEESPSEEYLDTTPWAREQRARQRWKEGVFKREAERERIREERERRGLVLGTDNPDPKPTTSRRRQREDLDLLFKEKEEEAKREKVRKLLDQFFEEKEEERRQEAEQEVLRQTLAEKEQERQEILRALEEETFAVGGAFSRSPVEPASSSSGIRPSRRTDLGGLPLRPPPFRPRPIRPPPRPQPNPLQEFFDNRPSRKPTRGERRAAKRTQQYLSAQRARKWAAESDAETEEPPKPSKKEKSREGGRR